MKPVKRALALVAAPPARYQRQELAFLPAALEILETPPSPVGRWIIWTIIAVFAVAVAWATFGTVDVVASATGKIVPTGRSKVVQPFETGVIKAIHVRDGQMVRQGELLIEIDPSINEAERDHLRSDLVAAQLNVARLRAATGDAGDVQAAFQPPPGAGSELVAMQRQQLANQMSELRAKLAGLDQQKKQREAERDTSAATIQKIRSVLPILEERVNIRKTLLDHETGSKVNYLEILQSQVELKNELLVQESRLREAEAALGAITEARVQAVAEVKRSWLADLAEAERKAAGLSRDVDRANEKTKLQALTSPIDGVVQQLAVHTVGGIVTPAQVLLVVVPTGGDLEIEAMVSNRDIGFVHAGQAAQIKVDTFNFTEYGLLHGQVLSVSHDAIVRDRPVTSGANRVTGSEAETSEPKGQELVYVARVSLDRTSMKVGEKDISLAPGMATTVEIRTGERSVMSYLLSPIMRHGQESLRER